MGHLALASAASSANFSAETPGTSASQTRSIWVMVGPSPRCTVAVVDTRTGGVPLPVSRAAKNIEKQPAWAAPGKLTKALCFSPKTELLLVNNVVKEMQELELGDTLEDGSIVEGIIKLQNTTNEMFYSFDGEELLVTGSHMILGPTNTFIPVHKHPLAKLQNSSSPILYCLITSTHLIKIGNYTFWDWDDDDLH